MIDSDGWVQNLKSTGESQEQALTLLRRFLVSSLHSTLDGRASADEAFIEDVVQIALVRIWEKLDSFSGRSKFTTWALSITIRVAYSELRRKHWQDQSLDQISGDTELNIDAEKSAGAQLIRNQYIEVMHRLIATKLTEKQKLVLQYELRGMPQDEIAAKLSSTRNSIYKLGHDARKALKNALESEGEGVVAFREAFHQSFIEKSV